MSGEVLGEDGLRAMLHDLLATDESGGVGGADSARDVRPGPRIARAPDATLVIEVAASGAQAVLRRLREATEGAWDRLVDLTIVDQLGNPSRAPSLERFEAVYCLRSSSHATRLRVHVAFAAEGPAEPPPELDSVASLWPAADWLEREAGELFGLRFRGHPAWQRLLLPADFEGAPLRKDFVVAEEAAR